MVRSCIKIILLLLSMTVGAAVRDTRTAIFNPAFHTLQLRPQDNEQLPPVIYLDTDDYITITFDELADERRYMRYELIHCDAAWRPDGLVAPEYLDGFNEGTIDDFEYSQATLVHYVNYRLTIPNDVMRPTVSGNYLLRIFDENDPEATLLQVRFCIVERKMEVDAKVSSRTDIDYNLGHQQLSIYVDTDNAPVDNIYTDFAVVVEQDGRIDNMVTVNRPTLVAGGTLEFVHNQQLIFDAGNEYRRMEAVSTTYPGMGVADITYADPIYHITLFTDLPRHDMPYSYDQTQFGRFKVREYNSDDSDIEADYVMVHFSLDMPELTDCDIFIDGDMVQRRFSPESRMVYNRAKGLYENAMLLKQGAYNYQYLVVKRDGSTAGSAAPIEGNHYQTNNQYLIKVYQRRPGERYDRLVGVTMITSGQ
ncbi:MAG: DUF5103 domain-containing protein [Bacteroides sp.]|nr:DUF5103 domain-containing protein [Bacteroides sp.]MCM1412884.1 DUF5103 domain-containing protein [Bacteroides sp.]MCM1471553.1 DUF5103 domain-containing protein [Bacteroides sp.]